MAVTITFLGHAGFVFASGDQRIAIDPFLKGNPATSLNADDIECNYIALTHGHADHFGDTVAIAKANDATVIAAYEITDLLAENGLTKCEPGNPGGQIATDFGWVAFTQAFHSSSYEGRYMGMPCGLMVNIGGVTLYHCGDTALFGDMALLGEIYRPAVAFVPIGDRFTMGPKLATKAAELIKPKVAVPIHYKTWPLLVQDPTGFEPRGIEVKVLEPGDTWQYG